MDIEIIKDQPQVTPLETLSRYAQTANIASELSETELSKVHQIVMDRYKEDLASRKDKEERIDKAMDLAMQIMQTKTFPWENAANVKFPLIAKSAIHFAERAYPAIINDGAPVKAKVIGNDVVEQQGPQGPQKVSLGKKERGDRISKYLSWHLMTEDEDWDEDTDKLLHILPITGTVFRKKYYDPILAHPVSEIILPKDCVVNNHAKSVKTAAVTHKYVLYRYQVVEKMRAGIFMDIPEILTSDESSVYDENSPIEFLEQSAFLDLDGDGYAEPYVVYISEEVGKVVRIAPRFELKDIFANEDGSIIRIEPIVFYTPYIFIPSLDGSFYGIGFGDLLLPLNEVINTTINQLLDAGYLSNTSTGFLGKGLRMRSGTYKFSPGKFTTVDSEGSKLAENIFQMNFKEPSATLMALLGLLIENARDLGDLKDVMTGDGASNIAATTMVSMVEQGMTAFKAIFKRIRRALRAEYIATYKMSARTLDIEKYQNVLDDKQATQDDFNMEDFDIEPVSDIDLLTDFQRSARAQLYMTFTGNPAVNQVELTRRVMELMRIPEIEELLAPAPQDPALKALAESEMLDKQNQSRKLDIEQAKVESDDELKSAQTMKVLMEALVAAKEAEGTTLTDAQKLAAGHLMELMRNEQRTVRGVESAE